MKKKVIAQSTGEKRDFYKLFVDEMPDGVALHEIICDENSQPCDYRFLDINPAFSILTGLSRDKILGKRALEVIPELEPVWIKRYGQVALTGKPDSFSSYSQGLNKHYKVRAICPEIGKFAVIFHDITERKITEDALQKKVEELRRMAIIVSDSNDAVIMHDFEGKILAWNHGAIETYGYSETEALGKNVREIVAEPDREAALTLIKKIKQGEVVKSFELRRVTKDNRVLDVWLTTTLLTDEKGQPIAIATTERNITERKMAEGELVLANKELIFQNEEKEKRAAELAVANEETVRQLQNIQALNKIDQAIAGSLDLKLILNVVLEQVKAQLNIDAAAVLLLNPHTQILEFTSGLGFRSKAIERSRVRLGEGLSGRAALERRTVNVTDLLENSTQFDRAPLLAEEGFVTYFGTPLIAKGQVNGVLEIYHRLPYAPDENQMEFFKILAGQAAIAVDSASLFTNLIHSNAELFAAYDSTIEGWSHALDLRDKETEGHTQRVTEMTLKFARAAGITEAELVHVRRGALLHDIGKMGVPDHILLKPDKLTDEEWVAMRKHPTFAFELLSPIAYLHSALDIPYCHHEKWDGSGYPRGLKGKQIPLTARLFAIVDVWDALTSDRPYRKAWTKKKALEYIKEQSGKHFDPEVLDVFLRNPSVQNFGD